MKLKQLNKSLRGSLLLAGGLCAAALSPLVAAQTVGWGAQPVTEDMRPGRDWIANFAATPDVVAGSSLYAAVDECDTVVGANAHCVIEVAQYPVDLPLYLTRSKTKLVGAPGVLITSTGEGPFIEIGSDTREVIVAGLDLHGHTAETLQGIMVRGENIDNVLIQGNIIHDFEGTVDAHGIAVYGNGNTEASAIQNVIIEGNEVYSMRTGPSESIVVNGNVVRWEIVGNDVYDVNNIAIDAIGGEGTAPPTPSGNGRVVPNPVDAARYGFIEQNYVENMSTAGNPAYGGEAIWAAAIYVDGGHHIKIADNEVVNASWGYEVGAENCMISAHVTLERNGASGSTFGDLVLGGYAEQGYLDNPQIDCDPRNTDDSDEGHGYVAYLTVKDNAFQSTNTMEAPITLQKRTTNTIIAEPGVVPVNEMGDGSASGDQNAVKTTLE